MREVQVEKINKSLNFPLVLEAKCPSVWVFLDVNSIEPDCGVSMTFS